MQAHIHKHRVMPCGHSLGTGEGDPPNDFPAIISHGQTPPKLSHFSKVLFNSSPHVSPLMIFLCPSTLTCQSSLPKCASVPLLLFITHLLIVTPSSPPAALQLALLFLSASSSVFLQSLINSLNCTFKTLLWTGSLRQVP